MVIFSALYEQLKSPFVLKLNGIHELEEGICMRIFFALVGFPCLTINFSKSNYLLPCNILYVQGRRCFTIDFTTMSLENSMNQFCPQKCHPLVFFDKSFAICI